MELTEEFLKQKEAEEECLLGHAGGQGEARGANGGNQGKLREMNEGWLFKYRSQILPEVFAIPRTFGFPESQLPVDCVDDLDPPVLRDLYIPPCRSFKSMSFSSTCPTVEFRLSA